MLMEKLTWCNNDFARLGEMGGDDVPLQALVREILGRFRERRFVLKKDRADYRSLRAQGLYNEHDQIELAYLRQLRLNSQEELQHSNV